MHHLNMMGKVGRDAQFGNNSEFAAQMYNNKGSGRDSGMSGESYNSAPDSTISSPDKSIADLDLIVEKWIKWMWSISKSKQDKFEFDDMEIVVNWARVDINQEEAKFDQGAAGMKSHMPKSQTLFRTFFTNKTDTEQEYSFKTERVTRQCCTFSFLKGFTREKEGGLTIKFPQEIVELGGGIRSEQTVECGKDQTKEEEISWGVDSIIRVPPRTRTIANLLITELNMERDFQVDTKIKGNLTVKVLNRKENNAFVKSFSGDIYEIVNDAINKNWLPSKNMSVFELANVDGVKMVKTTFKGKCKFKLGVEQHVTLEQENLKM